EHEPDDHQENTTTLQPHPTMLGRVSWPGNPVAKLKQSAHCGIGDTALTVLDVSGVAVLQTRVARRGDDQVVPAARTRQRPMVRSGLAGLERQRRGTGRVAVPYRHRGPLRAAVLDVEDGGLEVVGARQGDGPRV